MAILHVEKNSVNWMDISHRATFAVFTTVFFYINLNGLLNQTYLRQKIAQVILALLSYHIERHYDPFDSSHSAYGSITDKKLSPNLVEMMWFWCFFSRGSQVADGGWASAIFGRRLSGLHWRYILEWPENFYANM